MGVLVKEKGDLIEMAMEGEFDFIAHGCNCFRTMGAGIALQIAEIFPYAYEADRLTIYGDRAKLGHFSVGFPDDNNIQETGYPKVFNLYTQYNPGPNFNFQSFAFAFAKMLKLIGRDRKIGIPYIGCGIGGGDLEKFEEYIAYWSGRYNITLVEYEK